MFFGTVLLFFLAAALGNEPGAQTVLVRVNGMPITESELKGFVEGFYLTQEGREHWRQAPAFERRSVKSDALMMMIERRLLIQEAKSEFDDRRVDKHIDETVDRIVKEAEKEAGSRINFMNDIHRKGITLKEWKQFQADTVLIQSYLGEKTGGAHVRPAEMEEYYRRNKKAFEVPAKIHYRMIYIAPTARESREEVRSRAGHVLTLLDEGADFGRLARQYCSAGAEESEDGLRVVEVPGDAPDWMPPLVRGLEPGEISELKERGNGYVISKLENVVSGHIRGFAEVQDKILRRLEEKKMAKMQEKLLEKVRKDAEVEFTEAGRELTGNGF